MNQAIVTAFAILLVMSAVVQKGDSYIRAGREMVYDNQGRPVQFAEEYYDRPGRSSRPFKKGKKILQGGGREGMDGGRKRCIITICTSPLSLGVTFPVD